jgi:hypothetical protein
MALPHRSAGLRSFASVAAIAAMAQAAEAAPAPGPTFYVCRAARDGAFGHIWFEMEVPVDGSARFHRINWSIPPRTEGLGISAQWMGEAPVNGQLDDRADVFVRMTTRRRIRGEARIEIRRDSRRHYPSQFAIAGQYQRPSHPDRGFSHVETEGMWGELRDWMRGLDSLTFALVQRDGTVVAEDRLDAATLASAAAAIAAVRPELEAMAADYRHRCAVPAPVIVD